MDSLILSDSPNLFFFAELSAENCGAETGMVDGRDGETEFDKNVLPGDDPLSDVTEEKIFPADDEVSPADDSLSETNIFPADDSSTEATSETFSQENNLFSEVTAETIFLVEALLLLLLLLLLVLSPGEYT